MWGFFSGTPKSHLSINSVISSQALLLEVLLSTKVYLFLYLLTRLFFFSIGSLHFILPLVHVNGFPNGRPYLQWHKLLPWSLITSSYWNVSVTLLGTSNPNKLVSRSPSTSLLPLFLGRGKKKTIPLENIIPISICVY